MNWRATFSGILALALASVVAGQAHAQLVDEFQWNNLSPAGTQNWTTATNWTPPPSPPGTPTYPNEPTRTDNDTATIDPVLGANLAVALTSDLTVSLDNGDITVAALTLGVDGRATTITGPGKLFIKHDEKNHTTLIDDPTSDDPLKMADEYTGSYNFGVATVTSLGNAATTNTISAAFGSSETIDFLGPKTLVLAGGFEEIAVDTVDTAVGNSTNIRSHIGTYDLSQPVSNQTRLLISGATTTVVDTVLNPDQVAQDVPLKLNAGSSGIPAYLSTNNQATGPGFAHGIIDLQGGITGSGAVRIGTEDRNDEAVPLGAVALYANTYTGGTVIDRGYVILKSNTAFGTGSVRNGNPANEIGFNLVVEPGVGETDATVNRTIANNFEVAHDMAVKGNHSLTLSGANQRASNSAGWVNMLPAGKQLTFSSSTTISTEQGNEYLFDGTGLTIVEGRWRNEFVNFSDNLAASSDAIHKSGTGAVYINSSQFDGALVNTAKANAAEPNRPTIEVDGGNLHFRTAEDMGNANGKIQSTGGAVGLDDGTITGTGAANLMNRLTNFANRATTPFKDDTFDAYDHGGLMLTANDAAASLNFGAGGAQENARDMTVAAPETGLTFTGSITPGQNTYRLGGGGGTLTISGANKLTGANDLVVTNGGDYINPNGADRVRLGMVRLSNTNNYSGTTTIMGKYHSTLQDQVAADDVGLADEYQLNGTTLAVSSLADGNSSIGTATSAASLLIQGSTLRYEGAAGSTNRLFTVGTAGATLDASGSGAINFSNTGAIVMDVAEARIGNLDEQIYANAGDLIYGLPKTNDLLVGMTVTDSTGLIPADTTITRITSDSRVIMSDAIAEFEFADLTTISFGAFDRTLTLTGDNTGSNTLASQIADSTNGLVNLEKSGTGKWVLTNSANAYTGNTMVEAGTLSLSAAFLANTADVLLTTGGLLDLTFAGSDVIDELYIDGVQMAAGTWGSTASSAQHKDDTFFSGTGILNVTTGAMVAGLPGDFNNDGIVDGADYTVWRDNEGAPTDVALSGNGDGVDGVNAGDYGLWRANFGATSGPGSVLSGGGQVPEPSTIVLTLAGVALLCCRRSVRS